MATFEIYNEDCLLKMKDISDNSIDLIICDLPYGCLNMSGDGHCPPEKYGKGRSVGGSMEMEKVENI
jgi:DNA modification methylase